MKKLIISPQTKIFFCLIVLTFSCPGILKAQMPAAAQGTSVENSASGESFESDGCTAWFNVGAYRNCCVEHDLAYFQAKGWRARLRADNRLFTCVAKKGLGYGVTAPVMWLGVRIFGSPWFPIHKKRRKAVK
jgi:hypothetical protein